MPSRKQDALIFRIVPAAFGVTRIAPHSRGIRLHVLPHFFRTGAIPRKPRRPAQLVLHDLPPAIGTFGADYRPASTGASHNAPTTWLIQLHVVPQQRRPWAVPRQSRGRDRLVLSTLPQTGAAAHNHSTAHEWKHHGAGTWSHNRHGCPLLHLLSGLPRRQPTGWRRPRSHCSHTLRKD